jgi:hypothetical protein
MNTIKYKSGFKYQLVDTYIIETNISISKKIYTEFIEMKEDGYLQISKGYAWDGPSGPTIDTKNFMRGSLIHDALYQLMREKYINSHLYKDQVDKLLYNMCIEDGMNKIRAWSVYIGVKYFADMAIQNKKSILIAP